MLYSRRDKNNHSISAIYRSVFLWHRVATNYNRVAAKVNQSPINPAIAVIVFTMTNH